jgi:hypothetical protein
MVLLADTVISRATVFPVPPPVVVPPTVPTAPVVLPPVVPPATPPPVVVPPLVPPEVVTPVVVTPVVVTPVVVTPVVVTPVVVPPVVLPPLVPTTPVVVPPLVLLINCMSSLKNESLQLRFLLITSSSNHIYLIIFEISGLLAYSGFAPRVAIPLETLAMYTG